MNNIISNYNQIQKKRGIIREFLQSKFLYHLYSQSQASKLSFIGGTSLRLLRGLDRFSEDLDFDNLGLEDAKLKSLMEKSADLFRRENIDIEIYTKEKETFYFELKFPKLLYDLKISTDPREKLMIKLDYTNSWKGQETEIVLFNKYGFIENIVTNKLSQVLVQKLTAFVSRSRTQPRDIYDIVWLYSKGAGIDNDFLKKNKQQNLVNRALVKFTDEKDNLSLYKKRLRPFLFEEKNIRKLDLFENVLKELNKDA